MYSNAFSRGAGVELGVVARVTAWQVREAGDAGAPRGSPLSPFSGRRVAGEALDVPVAED